MRREGRERESEWVREGREREREGEGGTEKRRKKEVNFRIIYYFINIIFLPLSSHPGRTDQFVCCYHGWTFNLNGQLTKTTRMKGIENFRNKDWNLKEIPLAQWGPFIFLHFGKDVKKMSDVTKDLQPVSDWLTKFGYPSDIGAGMKYHSTRTYDLHCNWKIVNENYLDGEYHIPYLHPGLNSALDMKGYELDTHPRLSLQLAHPSPTEIGSEESLGADFTNRWMNIFSLSLSFSLSLFGVYFNMPSSFLFFLSLSSLLSLPHLFLFFSFPFSSTN